MAEMRENQRDALAIVGEIGGNRDAGRGLATPPFCAAMAIVVPGIGCVALAFLTIGQ